MKERLKVLFLGVCIAVFLWEIGLRLVGDAHRRARPSLSPEVTQGGKTAYTIVFLGDSFTYGVGASSSQTMPRQASSIITTYFPHKEIQVLNKGVSAHNTAQILHELPRTIDTLRPDVIVLLAGGANYWNYWGYRRYEKRQTLGSWINDQLYRIRIYRLVKLLWYNKEGRIVRDRVAEKDKIPKAVGRISRRCNPAGQRDLSGSRDGWRYHEEGRYQKARIWFRDRLAVSPGDSNLYNGLGWVCKDQEDYRKAIEWFRKGIDIDPGNSRNYNGLGWVYRDQGRYDIAEMWFKKGLHIDSGNGNLYSGLGWVHKDQEDYKGACQWFHKGIRNDPGNAQNYVELARVFREQGDNEKAIRWFIRALKADPSEGSSYTYLGQIYEEKGDYGKAVAYFKKGIEADPENRLNYYRILRIYTTRETDNDEMRAFLERLSPDAAAYVRSFRRQDEDEIVRRWIRSDLGEFVEICRREKVKLVLQNYPVFHAINGILREVAKEYDVPLVDQESTFQELWNQGERPKDYFVFDNHCNGRGYGIMARNVTAKILELKLLSGKKKQYE